MRLGDFVGLLTLKKLMPLGLTWRLAAFILSLIGLPFVIYNSLLLHAEDESLRLAKSFSTVISTVRSYYGSNVANNVIQAHGKVVLTENYKQVPGGIPIPATLSIELGEMLRQKSADEAFMFSFVSDMPFKNRDRRALDTFQEDALRHFRQGTQSTEYWMIEKKDDLSPVIRYAIPVRMEANCVACHNGHPDSPMRTWKVGDVRGIQDVSVSVTLSGQAESSAFLGAYLLGFVILGGLALRESLQANSSLKSLISEKQVSEAQLKSKSLQLQQNISELSTKTAVIEKAPFGIAIADFRDGYLSINFANEAFLADTGYDGAELVGSDYRLLEGPQTDRSVVDSLNRAIAHRQTQEVEIELYRKDGSTFWSRVLVFPTFDTNGVFQQFIICQSNISELKDSEAEKLRLAGELQESLKLESLGLTIAGIAHDLNTPIGVAITATSHLDACLRDISGKLSQQPENPATQDLLSDINESISLVKTNLRKAAELVSSFKKTSADAARTEWRQIDLRVFFDTLLVALSPITRRANCAITLECPEGLTLYTEPGSLSQVITNLVVNATIHAFNGTSNRQISIRVENLDKSIKIYVADNGSGMSDDVLAKVFTPFFTTNRSAGGSGLGLFSVKRTVDQVLKGKVSVVSRRDVGTTFEIELVNQIPG